MATISRASTSIGPISIKNGQKFHTSRRQQAVTSQERAVMAAARPLRASVPSPSHRPKSIEDVPSGRSPTTALAPGPDIPLRIRPFSGKMLDLVHAS